MNLDEWADLHGEKRITMDQMREEEREYEHYMIAQGSCPDCGGELSPGWVCLNCDRDWYYNG